MYEEILQEYHDYYLYNMTKKETKFIKNYISVITPKIKEFINGPNKKLFVEELDLERCDSRVKIGGLYALATSHRLKLYIEPTDKKIITLSLEKLY